MYMNQLEKDINFGLFGEALIFEKLKLISSPNISKTLDKFAVMDFECDKFCMELKTRRINSTTYYDTMIGKNKIDYIRTSTKRGIIAYQFRDGDYYAEITDEIFSKLDLRMGGVERMGTSDVKKLCYYIPNELLIKF